MSDIPQPVEHQPAPESGPEPSRGEKLVKAITPKKKKATQAIKDESYKNYGEQFGPQESPVRKLQESRRIANLTDFGTGGLWEVKEKPSGPLPYTKRPEEQEALIKDTQEQYKNYKEALELQALHYKTVQDMITLDENKPGYIPTPENIMKAAYYWQNRNQKSEQLRNIQKQVDQLLDPGWMYKPSTEDAHPTGANYLYGQVIKDTATVWGEFLRTGEWLKSPESIAASERFMSRAFKLPNMFNQVVGDTIKFVPYAWEEANRMIYGALGYSDIPSILKANNSYIWKLGDVISGMQWEPNHPANDLTADVIGAAGSMLGMALSGRFFSQAGKFASLKDTGIGTIMSSDRFGTVLSGGMSQSVPEYENALKQGASHEDARIVGLWNMIGGMTEGIPISNMISRIGAAKKFGFKAVQETFAQGYEEGLQEMFQQFLSNMTAWQTYDFARDLYEDIGKNGLVGFLSGMLMTGMGVAPSVMKHRREFPEFKQKFDKLITSAYDKAALLGERAAMDALLKLKKAKDDDVIGAFNTASSIDRWLNLTEAEKQIQLKEIKSYIGEVSGSIRETLAKNPSNADDFIREKLSFINDKIKDIHSTARYEAQKSTLQNFIQDENIWKYIRVEKPTQSEIDNATPDEIDSMYRAITSEIRLTESRRLENAIAKLKNIASGYHTLKKQGGRARRRMKKQLAPVNSMIDQLEGQLNVEREKLAQYEMMEKIKQEHIEKQKQNEEWSKSIQERNQPPTTIKGKVINALQNIRKRIRNYKQNAVTQYSVEEISTMINELGWEGAWAKVSAQAWENRTGIKANFAKAMEQEVGRLNLSEGTITYDESAFDQYTFTPQHENSHGILSVIYATNKDAYNSIVAQAYAFIEEEKKKENPDKDFLHDIEFVLDAYSALEPSYGAMYEQMGIPANSKFFLNQEIAIKVLDFISGTDRLLSKKQESIVAEFIALMKDIFDQLATMFFGQKTVILAQLPADITLQEMSNMLLNADILFKGTQEGNGSIVSILKEYFPDNTKAFSIKSKASFEFNKDAIVQLLGAGMYSKGLQNVAIKEMAQNAFDAVKVNHTMENPGYVSIQLDAHNRTIMVVDNGEGMSEETLRKAFFTLGGTEKKGLASGSRSGGLGLAKIAFLLQSERVFVQTVRDGVILTVNDTTKNIYHGEFDIESEKAPSGTPSGTVIKVKIPETYVNAKTGEVESIAFYDWERSIFNSPNYGPAIIEFSKPLSVIRSLGFGVGSNDGFGDLTEDFEGWRSQGTIGAYGVAPAEAVSQRYDLTKLPEKVGSRSERYKFLTSGTSKYYDINIYATKYDPDSNSSYYYVLSAGLFQFNKYLGMGFDSKGSMTFVIDIKPKVEAQHTYYPFDNSREGFKKIIDKSVNAIEHLLKQTVRGYAKQHQFDALRDIVPIPTENEWKNLDPVKKIGYGMFLDKKTEQAIEAESIKPLGTFAFDEEGNVYDKNNKLISSEQIRDAERNDDSNVRIENVDIEIKPFEIEDRDRPQFINVTNADFFAIPGAIPFMSKFGYLLKTMLTEIGEKIPAFSRLKTPRFLSGIVVSKDGGGFNVTGTSAGFDGIFINPFRIATYTPANFPALTSAAGFAEWVYHIIVHEVNHEVARNEGADFTFTLEYTRAILRQEGFYDKYLPLIYEFLKTNKSEYNAIATEYAKSSTRDVRKSYDGNNLTGPKERVSDSTSPETQRPESSRPEDSAGNDTQTEQARDVILSNLYSFKRPYRETQFVFEKNQGYGYVARTEITGRSNVTLDFNMDFSTKGAGATRSKAIGKYAAFSINVFNNERLSDDDVERAITTILEAIKLAHDKPVSINIAGNGLSTFFAEASKRFGATFQERVKAEQEHIFVTLQTLVDRYMHNALSRILLDERVKDKVRVVVSGGQTGIDEAGTKAAAELGFNNVVVPPKGWMFRLPPNTDISDEQKFKARFKRNPEQAYKEKVENIPFIEDGPISKKLREMQNEVRITQEEFDNALDTHGTFMSNFAILQNPIVDEDGNEYHTSEAYYFALRTADKKLKKAFADMSHLPAEVKRFAYNATNSDKITNVEEARGIAMREAVRRKFEANPDLARQLIATGNAMIVEKSKLGSRYPDRFFGIQTETLQGINVLGTLLMEARKELPQTLADDEDDKNEKKNSSSVKQISGKPSDDMENTEDAQSLRDSSDDEGKDGTKDIPTRSGTTSGILREFVDENSRPIFATTKQFVTTIAGIMQRAQELYLTNRTNKTVQEIGYQIFDNFYGKKAAHLAPLNELQIKTNGRLFIEELFAYGLSLSDHNVIGIQIVPGKAIPYSINIKEYTGMYPNTMGSTQMISTVYRKRFYEYLSPQIEAVFKDTKIHELKYYTDALKFTYYDEKMGKDVSPFMPDDVVKEMYKNGYVIVIGKTEVIALKRSDLLKNLDGYTKELDGDYQASNAFVYNAWNHAILGQNVSDGVLLKRSSHLVGNAPSGFLSSQARLELSHQDENGEWVLNDDTHPMWLDLETEGGAVMVRTVQLDTNNLPKEIVAALKAQLGWRYKDELPGDGAIFSLNEVHDMHNLLNGNPFEKWGRNNKWKTYEYEKQLLKAADQKAFEFSPIYKYMREHNIGRVILTSSRKIKSGQNSIGWNHIVENIKPTNAQTYSYNMMNDAGMANHGVVKKSANVAFGAFITTGVLANLPAEIQNIVMKIYKDLSNDYIKEIEETNDPEKLKKAIEDFVEESPDILQTTRVKLIIDAIKRNPAAATYLQSIDFYKANILGPKLSKALSMAHYKDSSYPTLIADMGNITGYREYFMGWYKKKNSGLSDAEIEAKANEYFDEYGFIRKGYVIIDELTYKKANVQPDGRIIVSMTPPGSMGDLKALKVICTLPNEWFTRTIHGVTVNQLISTNAMVGSVYDMQTVSGKDFDIDKVPFLSVTNAETGELWDAIHKAGLDKIHENALMQFDSGKFPGKMELRHLNKEQLKDAINIPGLSYDDRFVYTAKALGIQQRFEPFSLQNYRDLTAVYNLWSRSLIGEVYNAKILANMLMVHRELTVLMPGNVDGVDVTDIKIRVSIKNKDKAIALMDSLTTLTLDWQKNLQLLGVSYSKRGFEAAIFDFDVYYKGKWVSAYKVMDKVKVKFGLAPKLIFDSFRSIRSLLKADGIEEFTNESYLNLKKEIISSFDKYPQLNPNIKNSLLVASVMNMLEAHANNTDMYMYNFIREDVIKIDERLAKLSGVYGSDENSWRIVTKGQNHPLQNILKILNRFWNITRYSPFIFEMGSPGYNKFRYSAMSSEINNNTGIFYEINRYAQMLPVGEWKPYKNPAFTLLGLGLRYKWFIVRNPFKKEDGTLEPLRQIKFEAKSGKFVTQYFINERESRDDVFYSVIKYDKDGQIEEQGSYNTFDEMMAKQNTQLPFSLAVKQSLESPAVVLQIDDMFMFKGNTSMRLHSDELVYATIQQTIGLPEFKAMSARERSTFWLALMGIYDWAANDKENYAQKFGIYTQNTSMEATGESRTDVTPVKFQDHSPAYLAISDAARMGEEAAQTLMGYLDVVYKSVADEAISRNQEYTDSELYDAFSLKRPFVIRTSATPRISNERVSTPEQKRIAFDLGVKISDNLIYLGIVKPFQIANFWNRRHPDKKISAKLLLPPHKAEYAIHLGEMLLEHTVTVGQVKGDTSEAFLQSLGEQKVLEALDALTKKDPGFVQRKLKLHRFGLPATHMIRMLSHRNIFMSPTDSIEISLNSEAFSINAFRLSKEFQIFRLPDEPYMISGSMIGNSILRQIVYTMGDNMKRTDDILQSIRNTFIANNPLITANEEAEASLGTVASIQADINLIAEGIDKMKLLQGLEFWAGEAVVKLPKQQLELLPLELAKIVDKRKVEWNMQNLTDLATWFYRRREARIIADWKTRLGGLDNTMINWIESTTIRQIISALQLRYLYDVYAPYLVDMFIQDLEAVDQFILTNITGQYGDMARALIYGKKGILEKARNQRKAIRVRTSKLRDEGRYYLPHFYQDDKFIIEDLMRVYRFDEAKAKKLLEDTRAERDKNPFNISHSAKGPTRSELDIQLSELANRFGFYPKYRLDATTHDEYFRALELSFRDKILHIYSILVKSYTEFDNDVMVEQIDREFAIQRGRADYYRPITQDKIRSNTFVRVFIKDPKYIDKVIPGTNTTESENKAKLKELARAELKRRGIEVQDESSDIDKDADLDITNPMLMYGIVKSYTDEYVDIHDEETDAIIRVKKSGIDSLEEINPLTYVQWVKTSQYQKFDKNLAKSFYPNIIDSIFKVRIMLRNYSLLMIKPYYSLRNMWGNTALLIARFGKKKYSEMRTKFDDPFPKNPTPIQKHLINQISEQSMMLFGQVNELMGRIQSTTEMAEGTLPKELVALMNKINQDWVSHKQGIQPIVDWLNIQKRGSINWIETWQDKKLKDAWKKYFYADGFLEFVFDKHQLDIFPLNLWNTYAKEETFKRVRSAEAFNRKRTSLITLHFFDAITKLDYLTEEERQKIAPIIADFIEGEHVESINSTDFLYFPGLDLADWDSTHGGRQWFQFAHFGSSLFWTYIQNWNKAKQQGKMYPRPVVKKMQEGYEIAVYDIESNKFIKVQYRTADELMRAVRMSNISTLLSLINEVWRGLKKYFKLAGASWLLGVIFEVLYFNPLNDSAVIAGTEIVTGLLKYLIQSFMDTTPDDDDDEETKRAKKLFIAFFGESKDEFIAAQRERYKNRGLTVANVGEFSDDEFTRMWWRNHGFTFIRSLPGVGLDLFTAMQFTINAIIDGGKFEAAMGAFQNQLLTMTPTSSIFVPIIKMTNPGLFESFDPVESKFTDLLAKQQELAKIEKEMETIGKTEQDEAVKRITKGTFLESDTKKEYEKRKQLYKWLYNSDSWDSTTYAEIKKRKYEEKDFTPEEIEKLYFEQKQRQLEENFEKYKEEKLGPNMNYQQEIKEYLKAQEKREPKDSSKYYTSEPRKFARDAADRMMKADTLIDIEAAKLKSKWFEEFKNQQFQEKQDPNIQTIQP